MVQESGVASLVVDAIAASANGGTLEDLCWAGLWVGNGLGHTQAHGLDHDLDCR